MKKKKLLLPLAVMTLSCGLCAGILTGCGDDEEHQHSYTQWAHDDTGHWQICVEDDETSEKEPHSWGADDKCECGAEKPAYGTASGNVKLLKMGENVTDFTGVTIDPGEDDGIEIDYNSETGAFTISNARVGKTYKLAISKDGYLTTYVNLQAVKNQNAALGDLVLSYDAFTHGSHTGSDWNGNYGNPSKIDKSHVNDPENPYFKIGEGAGDFYVYSREEYDTVTAAVTYQRGDTNDITDSDGKGNQSLHLVFEDGKAVMIRIEKMDNGEFKAQWIGGQNWEESPIKDNVWDFGNDEAHFNPFSEESETKYAEAGIELKLVRNGGVVRAYVDGQFMGEQILPEEYAAQKCRVALAAGHPKGGAEIPFSISKEIPATETEKFESDLTLNTGSEPLPTGVAVELDKKADYKRGDLVTLSVTLPQSGEYAVESIMLGAESLLDNYADGKVSFMLTEATNTLTVSIKSTRYVDLTDVTVTGKKYDVSGNTIADGTAITLEGQGGLADVDITVTGGKFSKENVAMGTYKAVLAKYKPATVVVGEHGIEGGITLEYDGFESLFNGWDWDRVVLDKANEGEFGFNGENGKTFSVKTKDWYDDVAVTLDFKKSNSTNGDYIQGIAFAFDDGKVAKLGINLNEGVIQFRANEWNKESVWGNVWLNANLTEAEKQAFQTDDGLPITLVRKGGKLFVFIHQDGGTLRCANVTELPESYRTEQAQVGIYAADGAAGAKFNYNVTTTLPDISSAVGFNKTLPEGVEGITVEADKTSYTLGDTVTVTVTLPEKGYIVSAITVNGTSMLDQLGDDGTLTFTAMQAKNEVSVTVAATVEVAISADVIGKKYDVSGNSIVDGTQVTLEGKGGLQGVEINVADGKITGNVMQGRYTAKVEGYKPVDVTVGTSGIEEEIVFEYDGFVIPFWDGEVHDFAHANDEQSKIGCDYKTLNVLTKEFYDGVSASLTIKDANSRNSNDIQGIWLKFDDTKYLMLRSATYDNQYRLTYITGIGWGDSTFLSQEINLYFFNDAEQSAIKGENGIELQLVREGGKVYTFLGGKFVHVYELPEGYESRTAQVGFWAFDSAEKAVWDFAITKTLPDLTATVTSGTVENGTVTGIPATACKLGTEVTLTLTPSSGYILQSLTVGGKDVTGSVTYNKTTLVGTYTFTATADAEVVPVFALAKKGNVDTAISGAKYGVEGAVDLNGTKVKLSNAMAEYEYTIAGGELTLNDVLTGEYTLTAEGYVSQTVTVTESGITEAIVLVYNIFTSEPAFADLSELNKGKVTATGNGGVDLETKEKYTNVTAEAVFDLVGDYTTTQRRYSIALKFNDGKVFRVDLDLHEGDRHIVQEPIWDTMMGFNWGVVKDYTAEQVAAFANVTFKIERNGATVKISINGEEIKTYTLPESYANQEAQLKFIFDSNGTDGTKGFTFDITVPEATPEAGGESGTTTPTEGEEEQA